MRITNKTRFNTKALGKLAREVARRELWPKDYTEHVHVYVYPRLKRRGRHGCAPYNGVYFSLYLRPEDCSRTVASTIAHEAAHNLGVRHRRMPRHLRWVSTSDEWAWADAFPLALKAEPKAPVKLRLRPDADKLANAKRHLRTATTRAKRAQTILRKWQQKVRYYEKRLEAPAPVAEAAIQPAPEAV